MSAVHDNASASSTLSYNDNDVLVGPFKFCRENGGNKLLNDLADKLSPAYEMADKSTDYQDEGRKQSKEDINRTVVAVIMAHGGRFIKINKKTRLCEKEMSLADSLIRVVEEFKKARKKAAQEEGDEQMAEAIQDPPQQDVLSVALSLGSLSINGSVKWNCQRCRCPNLESAKCTDCGFGRFEDFDCLSHTNGLDEIHEGGKERPSASDGANRQTKQNDDEQRHEDDWGTSQGASTTPEEGSKPCLNFSYVFDIIHINWDIECAKNLLSSVGDKFESVEKLMTTSDSNFNDIVRQRYGFDMHNFLRLRDFRFWFKNRYLPATGEKPMLTSETWSAFRKERLSGYWRNPSGPVNAGDHDCNGNPQESGESHPSMTNKERTSDSDEKAWLLDEEPRVVDTGYSDQQFFMIAGMETLSHSSSPKFQKQCSLDGQPMAEENGGKRGRSDVSTGSQSSESNQKRVTKKAARDSAASSCRPKLERTQPRKSPAPSSHIGRKSNKSPSSFYPELNPLLASPAYEGTSEMSQSLDALETIVEDKADDDAKAPADMEQHDSGAFVSVDPPSQVWERSLSSVSSMTPTRSRDPANEQHASKVIAVMARGSIKDDTTMSTVSNSSQRDIEAELLEIVEKMKEGATDATIQIRYCGNIKSLTWDMNTKGLALWSDNDSRRQLRRRELIECVLCALDTHSDDVKVTGYALEAIECLCKGTDESFVMEKYAVIVAQVVKSMEQHFNDALSQRSVSLLAFLSKHKHSHMTIIEANGVHQVMAAMSRHVSVADVQEKGCTLLLRLSADYELRKVIQTEHVIKTVLQMMQGHTTNGDLQENGCILLSRFHQINQSTLISSDIISAVVVAMRHNSCHVNLLKRACALFGSYAYENEDSCAAIVAADGISVVLSSMRRNIDSAQVQVEGLRALSMFAYGRNTDICRQIVEADGIAIAVHAMERYKTNEDIQKYVCWTFLYLVEGYSTCRRLIQEQGVVELLQQAHIALLQQAEIAFPMLETDIKATLRAVQR